MKRNHLKFITFLYLCCVLPYLLPVNVAGQKLSRQKYRSALSEAVQEKNSEQLRQLLESQRGEAIRYMEALLDSGAVSQARGEIKGGRADWQIASKLADQYAGLFRDNFYATKTKRFSEYTSGELTTKSQIIQLKNSCRQDFYTGEFNSALQKYQQALNLANIISDVDEQAALLGNIGACRFYLGEFDAALEYYQKSLVILEQIGDKRRIGNRLGNIASVYNDKSDYPTAIAFYDRAIAVRKELDDKRGLAADYNNLGLVQEEVGEYNLAQNHYRDALALNQEIENNRGIGKNLANLANVQINLGNYLKALEIYEEALALRKQLGDRKGEGNDLGNMGIIYFSLGDYNKAKIYYQNALSIHQELGYKEGEAYQLGRLAEMFFYQGEYANAIKTYQEALHIHAEIGHVHGEAGWLEALGEVYLMVGDHERSIESLQLALEKHRSIGNRPGEANTLTKLGNLYLKTEQNQPAGDCFQQALQIYTDIGEKWGQCVNLSNLAYLHSLEENEEIAIKNWSEAQVMADELREVRLQGWLQLQLGDFYQRKKEPDKSAKAYEQGLAILEELDDPELRWQLYYGQGQLWEADEDYQRAYYSYRAAITDIEKMRGGARISELKAGIIHNRFEAYEAIIDLLLKMERVEEAFQYVERARSRNLLDLLGNGKIQSQDVKTRQQIEREQALRSQISQLQQQIFKESEGRQGNVRGAAINVYRQSLQKVQDEYQRLLLDLKIRNPEYAAMIDIEPLATVDIQQLLPPDAVLLEYLLTEKNTLVFVLTRERLQALNCQDSRDKLRGKITLFLGTAVRYMNENKLKEEHWHAPLRGLYETLIKPVQDAGLLEGKTHLVIVPQGVLHYLPFQALITEFNDKNENAEKPHFLIEDFILSYVPSASLLKFCREKNSGEKENLLLLAPRVDHLPMSEKEVINIAANFGMGADFYLNEEASESLVKEHSGKYQLLHFATTAQFNSSNPLFSRLALAESEEDDGQLEVHEIFGLNLNAYLVGLSACQTAVGSGYSQTIPRGDDLISLTRAFIYAGSPSVVASLWEVADPSTALLMERFYEHLKNMNKGEALAMAQRDLIDGHFAHPYYWAPFILTGDWK